MDLVLPIDDMATIAGYVSNFNVTVQRDIYPVRTLGSLEATYNTRSMARSFNVELSLILDNTDPEALQRMMSSRRIYLSDVELTNTTEFDPNNTQLYEKAYFTINRKKIKSKPKRLTRVMAITGEIE